MDFATMYVFGIGTLLGVGLMVHTHPRILGCCIVVVTIIAECLYLFVR